MKNSPLPESKKFKDKEIVRIVNIDSFLDFCDADDELYIWVKQYDGQLATIDSEVESEMYYDVRTQDGKIIDALSTFCIEKVA